MLFFDGEPFERNRSSSPQMVSKGLSARWIRLPCCHAIGTARSAAQPLSGWQADEAAARLTQRAFGARPIPGVAFEPLRITSARSRPLRLGLARTDLQ